ncbi:MAG TPA: TraR/DksA family transcriptional regulator [Casimicrobiaceae bacterium]|jgi:RNA polymerase-binding protein DksA|nr:TraR/DksA family transcriptional regulator [Casimicrobiaceae bacterium]HWC45992.1 TraR/DksA family transcriptional regulator [Casimicrobiaceae bacterium]HWD35461.1 TraR/DksA family transcriptional regulator [Casimicrobiaceae bacterium]
MALTDKELAELSSRLDARRRELMGEVRDELGDTESRELGALTGALPGDSGDQSVADQEADLNITMTDRHAEALAAVDAARERMRQGTYGYCVDCGAEIGYERLLAYPTAERCIEDQERVEKTYAHEGTPTL